MGLSVIHVVELDSMHAYWPYHAHRSRRDLATVPMLHWEGAPAHTDKGGAAPHLSEPPPQHTPQSLSRPTRLASVGGAGPAPRKLAPALGGQLPRSSSGSQFDPDGTAGEPAADEDMAEAAHEGDARVGDVPTVATDEVLDPSRPNMVAPPSPRVHVHKPSRRGAAATQTEAASWEVGTAGRRPHVPPDGAPAKPAASGSGRRRKREPVEDADAALGTGR